MRYVRSTQIHRPRRASAESEELRLNREHSDVFVSCFYKVPRSVLLRLFSAVNIVNPRVVCLRQQASTRPYLLGPRDADRS
ncbi:unnamed protein product [Rangifer tarandus platyrhynchus]|uniref:Uncharacterized protein n=1 Tax=Rangifer tarandus platyrhynchus TaxID=3082113 RepID=A0ABN8XLJ8_RANTA|nr:unnamed protein product [Rangifer tarandus platyrhynchus]